MSKSKNFLEKVDAMDVSGGVHPPEGYPKSEVPQKILAAFNAHNGASAKISQAIKYEDNVWMLKVDKFEARGQDFKDMISKGLTGVRVDGAKEILLYWKE